MTANNMAVLPDGVAFFTDTAVYTPDAVIHVFVDKTSINEPDRWGGVVSGPAFLKPCFDLFVRQSFDDAVEGASDFLREFDADFRGRFDRPSMGSFMLGGWSTKRAQWEGYSIQTWDAADGVAAFTLCREQLALRPGTLVRGRPVDWATVDASSDISARGIADFGRRVLEAQRGVTRWSRPGGSVNVVIGGAGFVTVISADGARTKEVCRWPDEIGHGPADRAEMALVEVDFLRRSCAVAPAGLNRRDRRRQARAA